MNGTKRTLALLDRDWRTVGVSPTGRRTLREWQRRHVELEGFSTLADVVDAVDETDLDTSSAIVWALLEEVADDPMAVRTVLQMIIPGLGGEAVRLTAWARAAAPDLLWDGDVDQLLVATALAAIRHAAGHRRSWPILSILRRVHRLLLREMKRIEAYRRAEAIDQDLIDVANDTTGDFAPIAAVELADLMRHAMSDGLVSEADAGVVWLVDIEGYTPGELAPILGVAPRSVAQRRLRAEHKLCRLAAAA